MADRQELEQAVKSAQSALEAAQAALDAFDCAPEQNVFASMDEAESTLEDRLRDRAHADCEGSYNCGADKYEQEFIVDGAHFVATLTVEYNRHDKTYYYIDGADFSVSPKQS